MNINEKSNLEPEQLPIFEDELKIPNNLRISLKHRNYEEIIDLVLISVEGKKINLKNYLPLPKEAAFGIGEDFFVEERRHLPLKVNIPDLKNYSKFKDITSPYEYLFLLFHEFGHVNNGGVKAKRILNEFYTNFPGTQNVFHLPKEAQTKALILESEAEIEAWNFAINQIKKIEEENKIKILPENKYELENIVNRLIGEYRNKYKALLSEKDKELFKYISP